MASYLWNGATSTAFATGSNWTAAGPPVSTDTVVFDGRGTGAVAASDQSAVVLASLTVASTFTYAFGDTATPLQLGAALVYIGGASGSSTAGTGSGRINWKGGTGATVIEVLSTATSSTDLGKEPCRIQAVNTTNKLIVQGGRVGVATDNLSDVATFNQISIVGSQAYVNIASGVTMGGTTPKIIQTAGTCNLYTSCATIQQDGGTLSTFGAGTVTTNASIGGTAYLNSSGTITLLTVTGSGNADFRQDYRPRTVTNVTLYPGATLSYDPSIVTITNPIQVVGGNLEDVTINVPDGVTVAIVKS